jgi:hypothetical protein
MEAHDCYLHTGRVCLCMSASNILGYEQIKILIACLILGTLYYHVSISMPNFGHPTTDLRICTPRIDIAFLVLKKK